MYYDTTRNTVWFYAVVLVTTLLANALVGVVTLVDRYMISAAIGVCKSHFPLTHCSAEIPRCQKPFVGSAERSVLDGQQRQHSQSDNVKRRFGFR